MASDTEITKVRIVIRHLLWQIREVRKDRDAAWKWVNRFANTLQYQDLEQDPDQYALAIIAEARSFNDQQRRKGQMLGVRKQLAKEGVTSPTQEQLDEKWLEMYGNETTADGDIREDSQDRKSGTSANHYGDAPHREAGDESATVSRNMRRVPQNEAPAHVFSGGRTAQGTMSPSPSGAAQDGKFGSRHACSDKDRREQWESNTGSTVPAVRPESGNIYDQEACQVSTDEARKSKVRSSSMSAPSGRTGDGNIEPEVLNFAYSGEFGNVSLTQDQYNELLQQVGNIKTCNGLIDDFSASLADGSTKSGNHFATLKKWAKARKRFNEEKAEQTHYETVSEHNMRVLANGKKWVAEHFGKEATNG